MSGLGWLYHVGEPLVFISVLAVEIIRGALEKGLSLNDLCTDFILSDLIRLKFAERGQDKKYSYLFTHAESRKYTYADSQQIVLISGKFLLGF